MSRRTDRVNGLLRIEISRVLATQVKDHRLSALVSVTKVEASSDLRAAKAFISVLGDESEKTDALKALRSASGFVRQILRKELDLKNAPSIDFRLDESIERDVEFQQLINQAAPASNEENGQDDGSSAD